MFAGCERNRIRLERAKVQAKKAEGLSQSKAVETLGLGIATVKRHWNK